MTRRNVVAMRKKIVVSLMCLFLLTNILSFTAPSAKIKLIEENTNKSKEIYQNNIITSYLGESYLTIHPEIKWDKYYKSKYEGTMYDIFEWYSMPYNVIQTKDSKHYIFACEDVILGNSGDYSKVGRVVKTDLNGDASGQECFDNYYEPYFEGDGELIGLSSLWRIIELSRDSGYVSIGYANINSNGNVPTSYPWILKIDSSGDILLNKLITSFSGRIYDVQVIYDDNENVEGYVLLGKSGNYPAVIKLDAFGEVDWSRFYNNDEGKTCSSIRKTLDGNYVLFGSKDVSEESSEYNRDVTLTKVSKSDGGIIWEETFDSGYNYDMCYCGQPTLDGGFILGCVASESSYYGPLEDLDEIWLIKTKDDGDTEWTSRFGGLESDVELFSKRNLSCYHIEEIIEEGQTKGYALTGLIDNFIDIDPDDSTGVDFDSLFVMKVDENGYARWSVQINEDEKGCKYDIGYCVKQTQDDGYIILCSRNTATYGGGTTARLCLGLIKLDSDPTFLQYQPEQPDGEKSGLRDKTYTYSTHVKEGAHPDNLPTKFGWDWQGDGIVDDWTRDYYQPNEMASFDNAWNLDYRYGSEMYWICKIQVIARDKDDKYSLWSDPLSVTMPKNRFINTPFLDILQNNPILLGFIQKILLSKFI
jgi:hypothetical protein